MADTDIEWATKVWNRHIGCRRISEGCDNCYPIPLARMRSYNPNAKIAAAFAGLAERRGGRIDWTGQLNVIESRADDPLTWKQPERIFVNSLSDVFYEQVTDELIADMWAVMHLAHWHVFLVLTKRHGRMRALLSSSRFRVLVDQALARRGHPPLPGDGPVVLPNVWLGVSVENQRWADIRIPALLDTPAAVRWISAEPLIGSVWLSDDWLSGMPWRHTSLDWVVVGGETGARKTVRPMHPAWARSLRDRCDEFGTPYFFKQWGQHAPVAGRPAHGDLWLAGDGATTDWKHDDGHIRDAGGDFRWPGTNTVLVRRHRSKHDAGRLLDGQMWEQYPAGAVAVAA